MAILFQSHYEPPAATVELEGNPGMIPTDQVQEIVWSNWNTGWTNVTYHDNYVTRETTRRFVIPARDRLWTEWTAATETPLTGWYNENAFITGEVTYHTNEFYGRQNYAWTQWQTTGHSVVQQYRRFQATLTSEEQQAREDARQRQREEESRRRLAETQRKQGAQTRAMELLEMILTPEEKLWRDQHDEIMVRGSDGGMYVIELRESVHGNIRHTDEHGCVLGRICVQPGMYDRDEEGSHALPLADGWVGQYLAIKFNEATMKVTGNWSSLRECGQPDVPILGRGARAA